MAEISKTADQALTVLLEVGEHGPMTPAMVSRSLGMNRTVAHRLLSTLHRRGFITRQEDGYVVGAMLVRIAAHVQPELRSRARASMDRLGEATGETVVLHVPDGVDAVVLDQVVAGDHVVRVHHEIGSRHPLSMGASGRALLAFMGEATIARVTAAAKDAGELGRQLEGVRHVGYALSHDELQQGVHGVAVPIFQGEAVIASMAILVPVTRASTLSSYAPALVAAAAELSSALTA